MRNLLERLAKLGRELEVGHYVAAATVAIIEIAHKVMS